jgi:hypothetical protein
MPNDIAIEPLNGSELMPQTAAPADSIGDLDAASIYKDLPKPLAKLKAMKFAALGKPPAFRFVPGLYYPAVDDFADNLDKMLLAGFDMYASQSGDKVVYNPLFIQDDELKAADAKGVLQQIVPEYGELTGETPKPVTQPIEKRLTQKLTAMIPKLRKLQMEGAEPPATTLENLSGYPQPPAVGKPSGISSKLTIPRTKNALPESPTSGPKPGAGRLLNAIATRAV